MLRDTVVVKQHQDMLDLQGNWEVLSMYRVHEGIEQVQEVYWVVDLLHHWQHRSHTLLNHMKVEDPELKTQKTEKIKCHLHNIFIDLEAGFVHFFFIKTAPIIYREDRVNQHFLQIVNYAIFINPMTSCRITVSRSTRSAPSAGFDCVAVSDLCFLKDLKPVGKTEVIIMHRIDSVEGTFLSVRSLLMFSNLKACLRHMAIDAIGGILSFGHQPL